MPAPQAIVATRGVPGASGRRLPLQPCETYTMNTVCSAAVGSDDDADTIPPCKRARAV